MNSSQYGSREKLDNIKQFDSGIALDLQYSNTCALSMAYENIYFFDSLK